MNLAKITTTRYRDTLLSDPLACFKKRSQNLLNLMENKFVTSLAVDLLISKKSHSSTSQKPKGSRDVLATINVLKVIHLMAFIYIF